MSQLQHRFSVQKSASTKNDKINLVSNGGHDDEVAVVSARNLQSFYGSVLKSKKRRGKVILQDLKIVYFKDKLFECILLLLRQLSSKNGTIAEKLCTI